MSDFPINIKVDPGDAVARMGRVHAEAAKLEAKATVAEKAFSQLGAAIRYATTTQINQAVRGFGSLTDAIQLEHKWLTTIRGDTAAYAKDVAALDAMLKRNTISQKEHAAALEGARNAHGPTTKSGGFMDSAIGQIGAIAGPAAIAASAISSISAGFEEMRQKRQAINEASVSMLRYKDSIDGARASVAGLRTTSLVLGSDIRETTATFLNIAEATSKLGLSEKNVADITRNLGLTMKTDGKSIGDVGLVLERLQFGMEKGKLEAGELGTIMRRFPPIAAAWEKEFGKTQEQLLRMAEAGKFTRAEIGRMFTTFETADRGTLLKRQQQLLAEFSGKTMKEAVKGSFEFSEAMQDLEKRANTLSGGLKRVHSQMLSLAEDPWADKRNAMARGLDALRDKAEAFIGRLQRLQQIKADLFDDVRTSLYGGQAAGREATLERSREAEDTLKTYAVEDEMGINSSQAREAQARARDAMFEGQTTNAEWARVAEGWKNANAKAKAYQATLDEIARRQKKYFAESESENDGITRGLRAIEKEIRDTAGFTERMLVNAYHGAEDAMVGWFRTGKLEWQALADQIMADLTRLAIRQAIIGGIDLFGSSGLDVKASAGADFGVRGYAGGGLVRGGGGATDTVPVSFWATQGERVIVQTQGQQMAVNQAAVRGPATPPVMPVIVHLDERAILRAFQSPMGATVLDDIFRKNPALKR